MQISSINIQPHTNTLHHRQSLTIKSIKSLVPLLDRILVQRAKAEAKTAGGIFLPEAAVKELNEAKVLAVGPGAFDKDGKRIAVSVKPGDKVLIPQVRCWLDKTVSFLGLFPQGT
jgi:chaperonin GroES